MYVLNWLKSPECFSLSLCLPLDLCVCVGRHFCFISFNFAFIFHSVEARLHGTSTWKTRKNTSTNSCQVFFRCNRLQSPVSSHQTPHDIHVDAFERTEFCRIEIKERMHTLFSFPILCHCHHPASHCRWNSKCFISSAQNYCLKMVRFTFISHHRRNNRTQLELKRKRIWRKRFVCWDRYLQNKVEQPIEPAEPTVLFNSMCVQLLHGVDTVHRRRALRINCSWTKWKENVNCVCVCAGE